MIDMEYFVIDYIIGSVEGKKVIKAVDKDGHVSSITRECPCCGAIKTEVNYERNP